MRKNHKILGTVALAGLVAAAGSAFTGGGLSNSQPNQFVGGTVTQTVTGAVLQSVVYSHPSSDPSNRTVDGVTLTFADAASDGKAVSIRFNGSGSPIDCGTINATGHSAHCAPSDPVQDITSLDVTVS